jgi:hypothetical protein
MKDTNIFAPFVVRTSLRKCLQRELEEQPVEEGMESLEDITQLLVSRFKKLLPKVLFLQS